MSEFQDLLEGVKQVARSLFAPRKEDTPVVRMAKPAAMSAALSSVSVLIDLPPTNVKTAIITSEVSGIREAFRAIINAVPKGVERATWHSAVSNLYAGLVPELIRQNWRQIFRGPCVALLPQYYKDKLPVGYHSLVPVLAGVTTASIDATVSTPFEALRQYRNSQALAVGKEVRFSWFMGYKETMARQMPAWTIMYTSMQEIREVGHRISGNDETPYVYLLIAGGPFAATFLVPTHPIDIVKIHQQQAGESRYGIVKSTSIPNALLLIYKHGVSTKGSIIGITELWRGCTASIVQRWPAAFIMLSVNEFYDRQRKDQTPIKPLWESVGNMQSFASRCIRNLGGGREA